MSKLVQWDFMSICRNSWCLITLGRWPRAPLWRGRDCWLSGTSASRTSARGRTGLPPSTLSARKVPWLVNIFFFNWSHFGKEFWLYHNDFLFQMSTILRLYLVLFINYHKFFFSEMIHVFNSFPPSFYALG